MFTSFLQYLLLSPSFTNVINVRVESGLDLETLTDPALTHTPGLRLLVRPALLLAFLPCSVTVTDRIASVHSNVQDVSFC